MQNIFTALLEKKNNFALNNYLLNTENNDARKQKLNRKAKKEFDVLKLTKRSYCKKMSTTLQGSKKSFEKERLREKKRVFKIFITTYQRNLENNEEKAQRARLEYKGNVD